MRQDRAPRGPGRLRPARPRSHIARSGRLAPWPAATTAPPPTSARSRSSPASSARRPAPASTSRARRGSSAPPRSRARCRAGSRARAAAGSPPSTRCCPASTGERKERDSKRGRPDGRSTEIQRLIGRSLRGVVDLDALPERSVYVDCDVLQADGGTRCASITGGYVALRLATPAAARGAASSSATR